MARPRGSIGVELCPLWRRFLALMVLIASFLITGAIVIDKSFDGFGDDLTHGLASLGGVNLGVPERVGIDVPDRRFVRHSRGLLIACPTFI